LHVCEQPSKTPRGTTSQSEFGFAPEFAVNIKNQDHFLDAKRKAIRVRKMLCRGERDGN
jgi:hypothetical protein